MNEFLYVEKYRPQKIEETILPKEFQKQFLEFVKQGEIPNLLLCGSAGVGKTTVAKALCNELGADFIVINGSDEGRLIDTLRTKIKNFASTVSLGGGPKVVILDEADYISAESVQPALRAFIEEFSSNCRFIFTCNYKTRIIEPLHSRCAVIDFNLKNGEKAKMASAFFKRVQMILQSEKVEFVDSVIAELIKKHFPDNRRILNELQRYSQFGKIDIGVLAQIGNVQISEITKHIKPGVVVSGTRIEPPLHPPGPEKDVKDFGIGAQILHDLKIHKIQLISNHQQSKRVGMIGYGLEITEYISY